MRQVLPFVFTRAFYIKKNINIFSFINYSKFWNERAYAESDEAASAIFEGNSIIKTLIFSSIWVVLNTPRC